MTTKDDPTPAASLRNASATPTLQVILIVSLIASLIAQRLVLDPDLQAIGWVAFAMAALFTAIVARRARVQAAPAAEVAQAAFGVGRLTGLAVALVCVVAVTWLAEIDRLPFLGLPLWILGLLSASLAVAGLRMSPAFKPQPAFTTREIWCLAAIVALAALARFSWINTLPNYYFNDEPRVGSYLLSRVRNNEVDFFRMGWNTWSGLGLWLQGIFVPLLGLSVRSLRLSSALMGTLSVLTTYLLAREMLGKRAALIAAILLAVSRSAIDFSRLGVLHAQVMFIGTFAFWCWWRALNTGSALAYLWTGIALGWCLYTYNAAYLLPLIWGAWLGLCVLAAPRRIATHWRGVAVAGLGFLVCTFAYLFYVTDYFTFARHWYEWTYMVRNRQVLGRIFDLWQTQGFSAALASLWYQVSLSWLGFTVVPDNSYGVGYRGGGMLDNVSGPLFVLGLAMAATRIEHRRFFFFVWWLPTYIFGGVLTDNPPAAWRMVGIVPLLAVLAALPLELLIDTARGRRMRQSAVVFVGVILAAAAWENWRSYFVDFGNSDAMVDLSSALSHDIENLPPDTHVFLLGAENSLNLHSEIFEVNFPGRRLTDLTDAVAALPVRPPAPVAVMLVLAPLQLELVDQLRALYPGGIFEDRLRAVDGQLMYRLVHLTADDVAAAIGLTWLGGGAGPADPFASLPAALAGTDTRWSGRVFWPSSAPVTLELRTGVPTRVHIGSHQLQADGSGPVIASLEIARGWQPFRLEEDQAKIDARPTLILTAPESAVTLSARDMRRDGISHGLQARYERSGVPMLTSIDTHLNLCTMESLFAPEALPIMLPFTVSWNGTLQVEESATFELQVRSTAPYSIEIDGSILCNEERRVIIGPTTCEISRDLTSGRHEIHAWWDGSKPDQVGLDLLQLKWRRPGAEPFTLVPPQNF